MFLKSLEIRGFKSFADKTELKFNQGITAVVGPNGSGKSNVSDAVRWVLGEQSAKTLRGSKMEDIIFTGTEYRKPIGLAQVSLILDNSKEELPIEYLDVKVTRRIFRSGESEYLINNSPCRLKDIISLFMDTGIGKEGYSLIGQGKIDAILSGKPEERRALLEEAAGIVKFKSRKIEAERKLENTEENLIRINDIIYTYEERLGPLELEKNKAIKYIEISNELQKKEVALIVNNLMKIEGQIETQKSKIDEIKNNNDNKRNSYKENRNKLVNSKSLLEELELNYSNEQKEYFFKKEEISKYIGDIELLKERIKNIDDILENSQEELSKNNSKLDKLCKEKEQLEKEFENKQKDYEEFNCTLLSVEEEVKSLNIVLEQKQRKVELLKEEEFKLIRYIASLKNKKIMLENELKVLRDQMKSLESSHTKFNNVLKINLATKINLEKELNEINSTKKNIGGLLGNNEVERNNLNENICKIQNDLGKISGELHKLEANKEMLNKLEKQYEGYNISVKRIMESIQKGKLNIDKSKCIVLGEAIKTNKGYETAIEISLGATISNIITKDEETAKYLINYLKNNRVGRATFLPLSMIRGKKIVLGDDIRSLNGYLGLAADLVEYNEKYIEIINYALGKTIICDNIDNALNLAKRINYRHRIVTLAGEIVNAGGALTGGSIYQKNMGIMSRKTEFKYLENEILKKEKIKKQLSLQAQLFIENNKQLEKIREDLTEKIYLINLECVDIKNKINNLENEIINITNSFRNLEIELKAKNEKWEKLEQELKTVIIEIKESEEKEINNHKTIGIINLDIKDINIKIINTRNNSTELRVKKAQLDEFIENKVKDLRRNKSEIEEITQKLSSLNDFLEKNLNTKIKSKEKIKNNYILIDNEKNALLLLEEKAKKYELEKGKIKEGLAKIESDLETLTIEITKNDSEIHKLELIYTKQENEKDIYNSRLNEEFDTTFETEKKDYKQIENLDDHKQNISRLKGKITLLGSVNVNAIEEFKELSEKYRFIITEKEDLEKAKSELLNVIEEMTSKMKVVFRQNFNTMNKYFNETFKELFKGGNAKLILEEGNELTGNIDINVQPPGKKLQNINLMSGGEKVLSAIAILFAILKMKPTPFCILDEIEAALDDANVNRYANFLKKFSNNIQFIVITHRKGTMEVADIMYGVTMEEKGISKIVSVDLSK